MRGTVEAHDLVHYDSADEGFKIVGVLVQSFHVKIEFEVVMCFSELIEGFVYDFEAMMERTCLTFH